MCIIQHYVVYSEIMKVGSSGVEEFHCIMYLCVFSSMKYDACCVLQVQWVVRGREREER